MHEIHHDRNAADNSISAEDFAEDIDLAPAAVDQYGPPLLSLGISAPGFPNGFLDHLFGLFLDARPDSLVLRPRPLWFLPLVLRSHNTHDVLWPAHVRRDAVNGCYRCHPFRIVLLSPAHTSRHLMLGRLSPLARRFPQILP